MNTDYSDVKPESESDTFQSLDSLEKLTKELTVSCLQEAINAVGEMDSDTEREFYENLLRRLIDSPCDDNGVILLCLKKSHEVAKKNKDRSFASMMNTIFWTRVDKMVNSDIEGNFEEVDRFIDDVFHIDKKMTAFLRDGLFEDEISEAVSQELLGDRNVNRNAFWVKLILEYIEYKNYTIKEFRKKSNRAIWETVCGNLTCAPNPAECVTGMSLNVARPLRYEFLREMTDRVKDDPKVRIGMEEKLAEFLKRFGDESQILDLWKKLEDEDEFDLKDELGKEYLAKGNYSVKKFATLVSLMRKNKKYWAEKQEVMLEYYLREADPANMSFEDFHEITLIVLKLFDDARLKEKVARLYDSRVFFVGLKSRDVKRLQAFLKEMKDNDIPGYADTMAYFVCMFKKIVKAETFKTEDGVDSLRNLNWNLLNDEEFETAVEKVTRALLPLVKRLDIHGHIEGCFVGNESRFRKNYYARLIDFASDDGFFMASLWLYTELAGEKQRTDFVAAVGEAKKNEKLLERIGENTVNENKAALEEFAADVEEYRRKNKKGLFGGLFSGKKKK